MTELQKEVLGFCRKYFRENDQLPTEEAIKARFGWHSKTSARNHMLSLERLGEIERNEASKYRFTRK